MPPVVTCLSVGPGRRYHQKEIIRRGRWDQALSGGVTGPLKRERLEWGGGVGQRTTLLCGRIRVDY